MQSEIQAEMMNYHLCLKISNQNLGKYCDQQCISTDSSTVNVHESHFEPYIHSSMYCWVDMCCGLHLIITWIWPCMHTCVDCKALP